MQLINTRKVFTKNGYIKLLCKSKFYDIKVYAVFPNNKFPIKILPISDKIKVNYTPVYLNSTKRNIIKKVLRNFCNSFLIYYYLKN